MNQWRETTLLTGAMESQDGIQRLLAAEQELVKAKDATRAQRTRLDELRKASASHDATGEAGADGRLQRLERHHPRLRRAGQRAL